MVFPERISFPSIPVPEKKEPHSLTNPPMVRKKKAEEALEANRSNTDLWLAGVSTAASPEVRNEWPELTNMYLQLLFYMLIKMSTKTPE